jgi:hypothetical protein
MDGEGEGMTEAKLPIFGTALASWRDTFNAALSMPVNFAIAFVIAAAFALTKEPPASAEVFILDAGLLRGIARAFLLTPLLIVVHRYVLLAELTTRYPLALSSPRFWRFAGFSILLHLIFVIPLLIVYGLSFDGYAAVIVSLVLVFAVIVISLHTVIIFPAVAVDAPNANLQAAYRDSKGRAWRVCWTIVVTGVPVIIVVAVDEILKLVSPTLATIVVSAMDVFMLAAFAATASHLYRAWSVRLGQPAG